ncbi:MAG: helix-turn-helix transcriptional regulator [Planctomycetes bacterium]|nr:helix-turn-helix transcriptional regulator [Planctomycetota bacterium]
MMFVESRRCAFVLGINKNRMGDVSVGELAQPFEISLPAVSKHLRVLERAGLLVQDPQGRVRRCKLQAAPMREAAEWVQRYRRFWIRQLEALAKFVEAEKPKNVQPKI